MINPHPIPRRVIAMLASLLLLSMLWLTGCNNESAPSASVPESTDETAPSASAEASTDESPNGDADTSAAGSMENSGNAGSSNAASGTTSTTRSDADPKTSTSQTTCPTAVAGKADPFTADSERWMGGYSVKDFGAKGDGKTDDLPAFEQAVAAAKATGNCPVFVPKGTYYMSDSLVLAESITLYGAYTEDINKNERALPVLKIASESIFGLLLSGGGAVIGLHIQCAAEDSSMTSAIFAYSPGTRIENCIISDAQTGIFYEEMDSNPGRGQIINVLIRRPRLVGAHIQDTYDFTYLNGVKVTGSDALKASGTGFVFGKNDAVRVQDCSVDGADVGFLFNDDTAGKSSWGTFTRLSAANVNTAVKYESVSTDVSMQPTTIADSTFSATKCGVEIPIGCRTLTGFSGCTFTVSGGPVFALGGSGSITVQNCTLTTAANTAAVDIQSCENAIFTDNTVSAGSVGFRIADFTPNGLVITGNTIQATTKIVDASLDSDHKTLQ